jgi:putative cell wall-binding protein
LTTAVNPAFVLAAYPLSGALGAFATSYGWLETPAVSRFDQSSLFMATQSFSLQHGHWNTSRVAGPDRYGTAIAISQAAFSSTAPVVYITTGTNFPDALSAAAAAAKEHGPLLLTTPDALPSSVVAELQRLQPSKVVVVGGPSAVSDRVLSQLEALQPNTVRVFGADRYATSQAIVKYAFDSAPLSTRVVYVATGSAFPDALAASGAAGVQGGAVLLVPGADGGLQGATVQSSLTDVGAQTIAIVGGTVAVSAAIERQLSEVAPVRRLAGADRFATAVAVNQDAFPSASTVLLATGRDFPDALTGAAWAGNQGLPLLESEAGCVPASSLGGLATLGAEHVIALGGTSALYPSVDSLSQC